MSMTPLFCKERKYTSKYSNSTCEQNTVYQRLPRQLTWVAGRGRQPAFVPVRRAGSCEPRATVLEKLGPEARPGG